MAFNCDFCYIQDTKTSAAALTIVERLKIHRATVELVLFDAEVTL